MSLEEIFVDGDVLDGHEPLARLVLGDRIDERRRIPVAEPVDDFGDVDGHGSGSLSDSGFRVRVQSVPDVDFREPERLNLNPEPTYFLTARADLRRRAA